MADQQTRALRRRLARHGGGRGKRYPQALRDDVGAWVRKRRKAGVTWQAIVDEIELSLESLRRWSGLDMSRSRGGRVLPVEVVSEGGDVRVVSPSGYRVEGLSLSDAAALLRELS
jgi:hypothetical protein